MDINLKGFKANCGNLLMGDLAIHNGRRMTESETRMAVNWGIKNGFETASMIPSEILDAICEPYCHDYDEYDDTPDFFTLETLHPILQEIQGWHETIDMTADELIQAIEDKYNE